MKSIKPTTPGVRGMTKIDFRLALQKGPRVKRLVKGVHRSVGRNNQGRITTRHKGGGAKRRYRSVSFTYDKREVPARVTGIDYDPNRTSFIALLQYRDGDVRYVLASKRMRVGDQITHSDTAPIKEGNATVIERVLPGGHVFNIELKHGGGGKLVRSGGSSAEVLAHEGGYTMIKLPSREVRKVPSKVWCTIGELSNEENIFMTIGKAGRSRHMGIRPTVRGSAMNPVDHPYGGGEGRQLRGTRRPKNKWGKGTRGVKTRNPKKYSNRLIVSRRKKK